MKKSQKNVEFRVKSSAKKIPRVNERDIPEDEFTLHPDDVIAARFEEYGHTPPRTRMNKKNRDWERKQKPNDPVPKRGMSRPTRSRVLRRNTMDCALLNEIFVDEEVKRNDKRSQALIREAEREMKTAAILQQTRVASFHEMNPESVDSLTGNSCCRTSEVPTFIESCNRYMSVSSRPIGCRSSAPPLAFAMNLGMAVKETPALHTRKEFHETFANLIKLGSIDRQEIKPTQEEHTWQTELKDLIWLELQACQADRTMEQQDRFLFSSRQGVPDLLNEIINYKFRPLYKRELSTVSTDSGLSTGSGSDTTSKLDSPSVNPCQGCMSLYCRDCAEQQRVAFKEVEELLTRLEAAEALYPSSNTMGSFHPVYKSESFVSRIKAMCLWYNITRQTRLKLMILGTIFTRLQGEKFNWPVKTAATTTESTSSSSGLENEDSAVYSTESKSSAKEFQPRIPKVQFQVDEKSYVTPSSSTDSTSTTGSNHRSEYQEFTERVNTFSFSHIEPLVNVCAGTGKNSTTLYRKFIENVLKSKGLAKAQSFLQRLHSLVLHKAQLSLEKVGAEEDDYENDLHDKDLPRIEPVINKEQIDELRRYGYWSPEAKSMGLPSYIPTFVFLSIIPLEFMHEFLRMRLETRPQKPNPLSLKQLMKELREGLTLALTHRENYHRHITSALQENEEELEKYLKILDQFDSTVKTTFGVYLDYVDQMVIEASSESHQKSALEKEWMFTKLVSPMIHGMHALATKKFCLVIRKLLSNISERLVQKVHELDTKIETTNSHPEDKKKDLFQICRDTQCFFTSERESSLKILFFAKTFCRDVEHSDFHREHYEEYLNRNKLNNFVCPAVKQEFKLVQKDVLEVRDRLKQIIERIQQQCCVRNIIELDEQDRQSVFSGYREVLHQGFKFGFEYNKDVIRLFEQKIMKNRDITSDKNLALGIVAFSKMWMEFVTERCERGRGVRPRWASQGLEFLILACDPQITRFLDDHQFEELKHKMDHCISHVIGINSEPEKTKKKASPRTRKTSSPVTSRSRTPTRSPLSAGVGVDYSSQKFLHPQLSLKEEPSSPSDYSSVDTPDCDSTNLNTIRLIVPSRMGLDSLVLRQIRVRDAVNRLDMEIENALRSKNLIGQVKALNTCDKIQIRARSVNFHWHRGIKIGQGRFGKVYTAVNNSTGELMAMKEIAIQPGETRALKNVADELKILEGITHRHLVRYYGIEVHREELLIFMELCPEGTLESLVEVSDIFPEGLTRRFTAQLLSGVQELHKHGIVHRDIKTANIFLVDESNSLKLGDFGSAVQIQAYTTVPGELQGHVGTHAYMAPEMFTKSYSDGHGRAADIWSVGCVVIEMASGKHPWWQYDSGHQIMFKVGMGEAPKAPDTLSQEGHDFLQMTLQHDPKKRWSAVQLLEHNFCKVIDEDCHIQDRGRHSFRRSY
ncbi:mitogen-activated protein kinase kinase kinase 4 isoform X2 [Episyrphus balteatus]|uniref:mitogen-activated protein kinase kinase kinase 4 isoform X2 n=1 Tax=Episyrphus balteatus TaxID=286459 RepID=UPI0024852656|nr:mitogen-activated protein kinase kinase kinase 4 isoform X2 [Episyrphus balteatus]